MGMKLKCITPLSAADAAAVAIAATPTAFAADQQPCNSSGSRTVCQSPGNVQIKSPPPHVHTTPMETRAICSSTIRQLPLRCVFDASRIPGYGCHSRSIVLTC
jgi:hypothetical protein